MLEVGTKSINFVAYSNPVHFHWRQDLHAEAASKKTKHHCLSQKDLNPYILVKMQRSFIFQEMMMKNSQVIKSKSMD